MKFRSLPGRLSVLGSGAALPGPPVETGELLARVERTFGVNVARRGTKLARLLGVQTRHFCRDFAQLGEAPRTGDANPDLAARALADAVRSAGLQINDLGYVLGHTTSPHTLLPSNIAWAADRLGYTGPFAELRQACVGFAHAVQLGAGLLSPGGAPIAIVGSETGSVYLDPRRAADDLGQLINLVQMGDGAGAIVLAPDRRDAGPTISCAYVGGLGPGRAPGFWLDAGGSAAPAIAPEHGGIPHFQHDFAGVRERAGELFDGAIDAAIGAGADLATIDRFLPHQANAAELPRELALRLGVDDYRIIIDGDRVGNLGSASIWTALHRTRASGLLGAGETVLILGAEATKHLFGGFVYTHG